ncbi:reverse transcriptase domain-containing protein [Tanacetum coccineum]
MFQDLRFDISFADALFFMPRFAPTIRNLLMNKEKLLELAKIPLNENCSAMLLKTLPGKLGDPGKFLIPCNFSGMDVSDPRVPLILRRSFLRTGHALIDVYGEEITLRVDNEAVTFNLDQTTRYSSTNDKSVNRIDIIDAVCEEYAPELLGISNNDSLGGNPTPTSESFTSEFILEEIEAYLKDDLISPEIDYADCNPEKDICLIEKLLNNNRFKLLRWDLNKVSFQDKIFQLKCLGIELKDFPSHLEFALLGENDKLPLIIAKRLLKRSLPRLQLVVLDWNLPFELMCDASDFAIGAVLVQRKMKHFQPIHYVVRQCTEAQLHSPPRTMEMLCVYAFEKFRPYLVFQEHVYLRITQL